MTSRGHALSRDELIRALIAHTGTTTDNGNVGGTTLQDRNLIGSNDFITNKTILIGSGNAIRETSGASAFAPLTGIITVSSAFSAQIVAGTLFRVINIPAGSTTATILAIVSAIFDLVNAELTLTETGGTITLTAPGTEQNVYINDAPAGEFYPRKVVVDLSDLALGETATIRTYYRIRDGGVLGLKGAPVIFNGVQAEPMKNVELEPNRFGVAVTIEGSTGVVVDWEAHYEV